MTTDKAAPPTALRWTGRVISALIALMISLSAIGKLLQADEVVKSLTNAGYPAKVILPIGVVELACVVIYCIPQTAVLGAVLLTGYLGGASATHVHEGEVAFVTPVIVGVFVWLGLLLRDRRLWSLLPYRS